jgi:hypothetical protein
MLLAEWAGVHLSSCDEGEYRVNQMGDIVY